MKGFFCFNNCVVNRYNKTILFINKLNYFCIETLNLEQMGVQEMDAVEIKEVDGGWWYYWVEMWGGVNTVQLNANTWYGEEMMT